jgi:predicted nucleic acid-binding protein
MMKYYYLDSCIWRDHYEDRFGPGGRPLGRYATKLVMKIMKDRSSILVSDVVVRELSKEFGEEGINDMFKLLSLIGLVKMVNFSKKDAVEAERLARTKNIPIPDALHAVIARDNSAVLVSQDRHFQLLTDTVEVRRPEDIL